MKSYSPQSPVFPGLQNRSRQHSVTAVGNGANGNGAVSEKITTDQVRAAVRSFWEIWKAKSAEGLADAYSTNSITFRAGSVSVEPGFMGIAHRSREYFPEPSTLQHQLPPIQPAFLHPPPHTPTS